MSFLFAAAGHGAPTDNTLAGALIALVALTAMEIVLGIDNIVFMSIVTSRLPLEQQKLARNIGLGAAMGARLLLLFGITWVMGLTVPAFSLSNFGILSEMLQKYKEVNEVTWKDLIMLGGGLFLINSSVREIHHKMEGHVSEKKVGDVTFQQVIIQIAMLDIIFSLDSVITAVGMVHGDHIWVMVTAVILAVGVMMFFSGPIANFVESHATVKMLALAFLLLIGVMLVAEGFGTHIPKGYIYFAMAFSLLVELLNLRAKGKASRRATSPSAAH